MDDNDRKERLELVAAIVLTVATVLTAWSAFQATKWSGFMSIRFSEANAARTESVRASNAAGQLRIIDVTIFADWLQALAQGETELQEFLEQRFRDELNPAFEAWRATEPRTNPDAPPSPFAMSEYQLADEQRSDELAAEADLRSRQARQANQRADNYVLTTVLFAAVLFFAGVSSKFTMLRNRAIAVATAVVILISGAVILATFPVEI